LSSKLATVAMVASNTWGDGHPHGLYPSDKLWTGTYEVTGVLITLIAYQLLMLGIGWWASKKNIDSEDYYLGGRKLGPLVAALSASASSSSAWSLLGVSGAAFAWGLPAVWLIPATLGGFVINWYLVAPRLFTQSRERLLLTGTWSPHVYSPRAGNAAH